MKIFRTKIFRRLWIYLFNYLLSYFSKKFRPNICKYFFILEKKIGKSQKSTFSDFFNFSNYFTIKHISVKKSCFWTTPSIPESRDNNECSVWSSIFPCFSSWKDKYLCSIVDIPNYPDFPWDFLKVRIIYKKVWRKFKISLKLSNFYLLKVFPSHEQEKCLDLTKRSQILKNWEKK